jgi:hypothetical protein
VSNLSSKLAISGNSVLGIDNFSPYYSQDLKKLRVNELLKPKSIEVRNEDLSDLTAVQRVIRDFQPNTIIHLAAQPGVRTPLGESYEYIQNNLVAFSNVLQTAVEENIPEFLYASSSSVYGNSTHFPYREDDFSIRPISIYGATKLANEIHLKREKQIPVLASETKDLLFRIGMPNAVLKVESKKVELSPTGINQISFLFDANKSGNFEPLQKVASGGELSRLMLVLKSLVANSLEMPTLIFDEIDSGISGEAARQVGILMGELASSHQVISITHQPQIAARADHHLYVYKQELNGAINTDVKLLTKNESVMAIAKMLAGENPSEAALANAREMMN